MMIICFLVRILTTHTHTRKKQQTNKQKNDIADTNNYCNVLTQYIHYIPFVHTMMDVNDVFVT